MEDEEGADLLDHIPVQLWRLVQTGEEGGEGVGAGGVGGRIVIAFCRAS